MSSTRHIASVPLNGNPSGMYRNIWSVTDDDGVEYRVETWRVDVGAPYNSCCECHSATCDHGRAIIRHQEQWDRAFIK